MIGLYINWDFDSEIINIYGFPLKYYGLLFGGGLLLSTYILKGNYKRENLKTEYGNWIEGVVLGGNLRCFSKVIGTEYMPEFANKNILIEAWSGDEARFRTYLYQMKQAGIFKKVKGVILGTFTELEKEKSSEYIYNMAKEITEVENIVKLSNLGHNSDSYTILMG